MLFAMQLTAPGALRIVRLAAAACPAVDAGGEGILKLDRKALRVNILEQALILLFNLCFPVCSELPTVSGVSW